MRFTEVVPDHRFFDPSQAYEGEYPEISLEVAIELYESAEGFVVFFEDESWRPEFGPRSENSDSLTLLNRPILLLNAQKGSRQKIELPVLDHPIYVHKDGSINGNNLTDDTRGKKIVDAAFRIFRKMADNRFRIVDLRTNALIKEERFAEWYGPDMASFCLSHPGHYLSVHLEPEKDRLWGYLPADAPQDRT